MSIVLSLVLALFGTATPAVVDSCSVLLPTSLAAQLAREYPDHHSPQESDNLAEDIDYARSQGGSGCLRIAKTDFDGDQRLDRALLLVGKTTLVLAAFKRKNGWQLEVVTELAANDARTFLGIAEPGLYKRTETAEGPLGKNELATLRATRPGVVVGRTESANATYFRIRPKQWKFVWTAD